MLVIAHRGASAVEPENTILAIEAALNAGAGAIEFDVQGVVHNGSIELVALHDRFLERSTNGRGRVIDHNFQSLRALNAGKQQKIPTLWEKLQVISSHHHQCLVNIELKTENSLLPALATMMRAVKELKFSWEQFLLSSFYHPLLVTAKQRLPQLKTAALIAHCPLDYARFAEEFGAGD
jgi:glycerophosphoryl diester phosphodiesterase